ncbi:MAG: extracellular solute-binding protein [Acidobacteriota bacterium]
MTRVASARLTAGAMQVLVCLGAGLIVIIGGVPLNSQSGGQLTLCHAGSLQAAFTEVEKAFAAQHPGVAMKAVPGGSVALAGRLAAGSQSCDVYAAADYADIDLLLKPIGLADYTIIFAKGRMVLAYLATDPMTRGVAAAGDFNPPASIPNAAPDWYRVLLEPGVRIAGSHPFLDPAGYRSHMIFQLAQTFYNLPNLANLLLEHYTILPNVGGPDTAPQPALGRGYNFQFIYEHSAAAAATSNSSYRYLALPERIDLSTTGHNRYYADATVTIPGIGSQATKSPVSIPATRVAWGLTIPRKSQNPENAAAFVNLLLGAVGTAALNASGPAPITPALVNRADYTRLPKAMQSLVSAQEASVSSSTTR